jgi:peptide/nickel transport system permease protein
VPDEQRRRRAAATPTAVAAFAEAPDAAELPGGGWRRTWRVVSRDTAARAAVLVLVLVALSALLAPVISPYDPNVPLDPVGLKVRPPSPEHWLGTDGLSRDVLSRVLAGARISLSVASLSVLLAATIGTAVGAVAGYAGGAVDTLLMRTVDTLLAIPRLLVLLCFAALWPKPGVATLVVLIGATGWFGVARLVRAEVLSVRTRDFVVAARGMGAGHARVLVRHVVPQVLSPVLVAATLGVGNAVVLEAGLSYLGASVAAPQASWGNIIRDAGDEARSAWWLTVFPGVALVLTVLAVNVLADRLRAAMSPRQLPAP